MSTPDAPPRLLDRLFGPYLPPALLRDYQRHYLPYVRWPLLILGPLAVFAALTLYALNPVVHGQLLAELGRPPALALLALLAAVWIWMLLARQVHGFSRASLGFLAAFYALVVWLSQAKPELLLWFIPQFLIWQLAIAPLTLRPSTFLRSLALTIAAPVMLLASTDTALSAWLVLALHMIGIGASSSIVFGTANRMRRESFLAARKMRIDAFSDSLTGMLTRRRFFDLATRSMDYAHSSKWPVCVCFLDLDDFKRLNDQRGHAFGDRVLVAAAQCLLDLRDVVGEQTQERVAARHVVPGRMGGEEFALLLVGYRLAEARAVAESLLERIRALRLDDARITASAGIAEHQAGESLGQLLHRADLALLQAKRAGKDQLVEATATPSIGAGPARHVRPG